ncbi:hypothetical protein CWC39_02115 [Corynebacterium heidelbergense]|uniref:Uncharacterized protein n=1 Tax=Corynebacterium heidelbergense TaxID=2055947 RepID=A0A364VD86_9CORY|nr:hypothetical protein CWC39_02115 [Corynebacterium heidelbergense]
MSVDELSDLIAENLREKLSRERPASKAPEDRALLLTFDGVAFADDPDNILIPGDLILAPAKITNPYSGGIYEIELRLTTNVEPVIGEGLEISRDREQHRQYREVRAKAGRSGR